ncbi:hypothetical protein PRVXT_002212 [Proteinivorax tanatarense]|uniref:Uncharacterized protein n=1 Tax=Proteinivorax tanatarense TaxID=1260629 RepID=A0AAU7VJ88_9FIRM
MLPINKAQKAVSETKDQVERRLHVANYDRVASAAKLLKMPFMVVHTPTDILRFKIIWIKGLGTIKKQH